MATLSRLPLCSLRVPPDLVNHLFLVIHLPDAIPLLGVSHLCLSVSVQRNLGVKVEPCVPVKMVLEHKPAPALLALKGGTHPIHYVLQSWYISYSFPIQERKFHQILSHCTALSFFFFLSYIEVVPYCDCLDYQRNDIHNTYLITIRHWIPDGIKFLFHPSDGHGRLQTSMTRPQLYIAMRDISMACF